MRTFSTILLLENVQIWKVFWIFSPNDETSFKIIEDSIDDQEIGGDIFEVSDDEEEEKQQTFVMEGMTNDLFEMSDNEDEENDGVPTDHSIDFERAERASFIIEVNADDLFEISDDEEDLAYESDNNMLSSIRISEETESRRVSDDLRDPSYRQQEIVDLKLERVERTPKIFERRTNDLFEMSDNEEYPTNTDVGINSIIRDSSHIERELIDVNIERVEQLSFIEVKADDLFDISDDEDF